MYFLHHLVTKRLFRAVRQLTKGVADVPRKPRSPSEGRIIDAEYTNTTPARTDSPSSSSTTTQEISMTNEAATPETEAETLAARVLTAEERKARLLIAETRVRDHMMVSLGVGLLPFPLLDLAAAVTTQVTLVKRLCTVYEVPFSESRTRSIVTSLLGTLGVAGSALIIGASFSKLIPGSGTALGMLSLPLMSAAYTYAIGNLFIGHFEIGGTLEDLQSQKYSAYFRDLYKRGKETAACLIPKKKGDVVAPADEIIVESAPQAQAS